MTLTQLILEKRVTLLIALSTLLAIMVVLLVIERRISQKRKTQQLILPEPDALKELDWLTRQHQPVETTMAEIDRIAKTFFSHTYGFKEGLDYSEMQRFFIGKNKLRAAQFSHKMMEHLYGGEPIDGYSLAVLISLLKKIISEDKPNQQQTTSLFFKIFGKFIGMRSSPKEIVQEEPSKEDMGALILENVRNLKPLIIKQEPVQMPRNLSPKSSPRESHPIINAIDSLDRIAIKVRERKNTLW